MNVIISRSDQIPGLLDMIHDYWFGVEEIKYDAAQCAVEMSFSRKRPRQGRRLNRDVLVKISHVNSLRVEDTEKVGFYDVNELCYLPNQGELIITGGVPITIRIAVERLYLEAITQ